MLKADVHGSLEALTDALRKLDQEHDEVRLSFVHRAVGGITESDINLAAVANATVIGFNVRPDRQARALAESEKVEMRLYEVIYEVLDDVNKALLGMLKPEYEEVVTGDAEVREIFSVPRSARSRVATCSTASITRGSKVRFLREGTIIWKGSIATLRRFKDDVREVREGFECGIGLENFTGPQARRRHRDLRGARDRAGLSTPGSTVVRQCALCTRPRSASISMSRTAGRSRRSGRRSVPSSTGSGTGSRCRSPRWTTRTSGSGRRSASRSSTAARRTSRRCMASVERFVAAAPDVELLDIETAWLESMSRR